MKNVIAIAETAKIKFETEAAKNPDQTIQEFAQESMLEGTPAEKIEIFTTSLPKTKVAVAVVSGAAEVFFFTQKKDQISFSGKVGPKLTKIVLDQTPAEITTLVTGYKAPKIKEVHVPMDKEARTDELVTLVNTHFAKTLPEGVTIGLKKVYNTPAKTGIKNLLRLTMFVTGADGQKGVPSEKDRLYFAKATDEDQTTWLAKAEGQLATCLTSLANRKRTVDLTTAKIVFQTVEGSEVCDTASGDPIALAKYFAKTYFPELLKDPKVAKSLE